MVRRRNLRLPSSSDEDDDPQIIRTLNPQNPNPNLPTSPPPSPPQEIFDEDEEFVGIPDEVFVDIPDEDEEFVDVPDNFSDPSPPNHVPNPNTTVPTPNTNPNPTVPSPNPISNPNYTVPSPNPNPTVPSPNPNPTVPSPNPNPTVPSPNPNPNPKVDMIDGHFCGLGLRLRREWLESCVSALEVSGSGFGTSDIDRRAGMCFGQFLLSDMNYSGAGVLPADVSRMHKAELQGPFVLQVDEIVNICSSLRERYHDAPAGLKRCLKLSLTDGVQRVFAMEYRPIMDLNVLAPAGMKVVVRNIHIRRGLLMLVPEVIVVLGGVVEDLEMARQRLVDEVNKPPRSKRKRTIPPLSKRATLAAWPVATTDNNRAAAQANISAQHGSNNPQQTVEAATLASSTSVAETSIIGNYDSHNIGRNTTEESIFEAFVAPQTAGSIVEEPLTGQGIEGSIFEEFISPHTAASVVEEHLSALGVKGSTFEEFVTHTVGGNVGENPAVDRTHHADQSTHINADEASEDDHMSDGDDAIGDVERPFILTGDKESPFTYVACLLAKWIAQKDHIPFIQGTIKCILTGVKRFSFKHRSSYELQVYVDDGSLISEVIIDHEVVEKGIGHSPEEVTVALSSSDKQTVTDMKEAMKSFQLFLATFEGTMLVEINKDSSFPIAREMNHGCSTSDAWLLLRRLKELTSPQRPLHGHLNPIDLSP